MNPRDKRPAANQTYLELFADQVLHDFDNLFTKSEIRHRKFRQTRDVLTIRHEANIIANAVMKGEFLPTTVPTVRFPVKSKAERYLQIQRSKQVAAMVNDFRRDMRDTDGIIRAHIASNLLSLDPKTFSDVAEIDETHKDSHFVRVTEPPDVPPPDETTPALPRKPRPSGTL